VLLTSKLISNKILNSTERYKLCSAFFLKIDFRVRKYIPELFFCSRRIDNYIGGMFVALTLYRVTIRSPLLQQRAVWPFCPCAASIFSMSSEANTSHPHHTVDSRFSKWHFFTYKIVLCTFYSVIFSRAFGARLSTGQDCHYSHTTVVHWFC
jgi:hypothetical protein